MKVLTSVRFARLGGDDRSQLSALFGRLSEDDRRSRFMSCTTDATIAAHIAALDLTQTLAIGAWSKDGALVAVVEGFRYQVAGQCCLEAAFVTDAAWRRLGLARQLLSALVEEAAHSRTPCIVATYEARNKAMVSLVRATAATSRLEAGEVTATWQIQTRAAQTALPALEVVPTPSPMEELSFA